MLFTTPPPFLLRCVYEPTNIHGTTRYGGGCDSFRFYKIIITLHFEGYCVCGMPFSEFVE